MNQPAATRKVVLFLCVIATTCLGQETPHPDATHPDTPHPTKFAGCVQRATTDKSTVILSGETVCAKLTGTFSAEKLIGHQVDLKGVLTERTAANPASIQVGSINSVGKSCSNTCSLQPPGTRGLHGGEKPGKEGGTPGAAPKTPPQ
jgi:hypothetical protein